jgi:hypothetical protein
VLDAGAGNEAEDHAGHGAQVVAAVRGIPPPFDLFFRDRQPRRFAYAAGLPLAVYVPGFSRCAVFVGAAGDGRLVGSHPIAVKFRVYFCIGRRVLVIGRTGDGYAQAQKCSCNEDASHGTSRVGERQRRAIKK